MPYGIYRIQRTFAVLDIIGGTFANIITRPFVANYEQAAGFYCWQSTTGQPDQFSSTSKYTEAPSLLLPICPPITAMKRSSYCQINGSIALWVVLLAWLEDGRPVSLFRRRGAFFVFALNAKLWWIAVADYFGFILVVQDMLSQREKEESSALSILKFVTFTTYKLMIIFFDEPIAYWCWKFVRNWRLEQNDR